MPALDDAAIATALGHLPGWSRDGDALVTSYRRTDWQDAISLVDAIGAEAGRRNHHPDVCITGYRTVTLRLTTHSEGGITERDVKLATWIHERASA